MDGKATWLLYNLWTRFSEQSFMKKKKFGLRRTKRALKCEQVHDRNKSTILGGSAYSLASNLMEVQARGTRKVHQLKKKRATSGVGK